MQRLRVHLTSYERSGIVEIWDDTKIAPGDRWHSEIQVAIDRAAASIVLISADFLASDFVSTHELPKLLRKAERAGSKVLPIIVEPCELAIHPELTKLQALNSPQEPLAAMSRANSEHVWARAVSVIGDLFSAAGDRKRPSSHTSQPAQPGDDQVFAVAGVALAHHKMTQIERQRRRTR